MDFLIVVYPPYFCSISAYVLSHSIAPNTLIILPALLCYAMTIDALNLCFFPVSACNAIPAPILFVTSTNTPLRSYACLEDPPKLTSTHLDTLERQYLFLHACSHCVRGSTQS
jgi:hypothetical protein